MEEGEAKDLEFDRDDVNALKKRLRENGLAVHVGFLVGRASARAGCVCWRGG